MREVHPSGGWPSGRARAALVLAVLMGGCNLDEIEVPELSGPSEMGTAIRLTANPDVITADGFSTSLVGVEVFDQNGAPAANRTVLLALSDTSGRLADIGTLNATNGSRLRAAEATVVTGSNGVANAVYTAPPRTDFTADQFVVIQARPVGTDATGIVYRSVRIELKSAEPRLFPQISGNAAPDLRLRGGGAPGLDHVQLAHDLHREAQHRGPLPDHVGGQRRVHRPLRLVLGRWLPERDGARLEPLLPVRGRIHGIHGHPSRDRQRRRGLGLHHRDHGRSLARAQGERPASLSPEARPPTGLRRMLT